MPMAHDQINITLGTAGHIDHGKTALVKSLTGCETDRLREEKERGMSIDLGYAPCTIGDLEVGIVDVPGHEHFIKTMVAGAAGMDGVILVVAADDGVMPQTREHLDILTLLGIRHGLVALTKIDRVSAEDLEFVQAELASLFKGRSWTARRSCPSRTLPAKATDRSTRPWRRWSAGSPRKPPAACSVCRSTGRFPLRATGPWWPGFRSAARLTWATRSSSCRRG
jgi:small GTP-binding protein